MKHSLFVFSIFILYCCTNGPQRNITDNVQSDTISKYNPKIDQEYFYPKEEREVLRDTIYAGYVIKAIIYPIKDKYVVLYNEHADSSFKKIVTDKINYRDFGVKININDSKGTLIADKLISKFDFDTIIKPNPDNYFIRDIKFISFKDKEFRFDIKIAFTDCTDENYYMIEYYISTNNRIRFKNFPETFYEALYPEPEYE